MTIRDIIKKFSEKKAIKKAKFKEAEENMKIERLLEERQKSANRRELERYMKEQEEIQIKKQLDSIRKKQNQENWKGTNLIKGTSILKNDRPILKEKNIFKHSKSNNLIRKGDFFKW